MKILQKLMLVLCLLIASSDTQTHYGSQVNTSTMITAGVVLGGAALVYACTDSNAELLRKADFYIQNIDTYEDLLPSANWQGTQEAYFEQYLQSKMGLELKDITLGGFCNHSIVSRRIQQAKNELYAARQCVQFRSHFFNEMSNKLSEIDALESLLNQAGCKSHYYDSFLRGHQILNFHATLPVHDKVWFLQHSLFEQQASLATWIRRGYFSEAQYPLMSYKEQIEKDLKFLISFLDTHHQWNMNFYPNLSKKLHFCRESLEYAYNLLLESCAYQVEKDDKYKADMLAAEQAKARAQQQAAYAQQQQVWALYDQADAQRQANRIAAENKKDK